MNNTSIREVVCEKASILDADVIVMASHRKGGFKEFFVGSVTNYALHHSKVPLIVYKTPKETKKKRELSPSKKKQGRRSTRRTKQCHHLRLILKRQPSKMRKRRRSENERTRETERERERDFLIKCMNAKYCLYFLFTSRNERSFCSSSLNGTTSVSLHSNNGVVAFFTTASDTRPMCLFDLPCCWDAAITIKSHSVAASHIFSEISLSSIPFVRRTIYSFHAVKVNDRNYHVVHVIFFRNAFFLVRRYVYQTNFVVFLDTH